MWGADGGDRDMLRQLVRRLRSKIKPCSIRPNPFILKPFPAWVMGLLWPLRLIDMLFETKSIIFRLNMGFKELNCERSRAGIS